MDTNARMESGRSLDPRIAHPDTAYSARGYYLDPFQPELTGLRIDPGLVATANLSRAPRAPRYNRRQVVPCDSAF